MADVDEVWASLQSEESEKRKDYKKRVKEVAKKRQEAGGEVEFDLSQFMANANNPSSSSKAGAATLSSSSTKKSSSSSGGVGGGGSSSSKTKEKDKEKEKKSKGDLSVDLDDTSRTSSEALVPAVPISDLNALLPLISRDLVNFSSEDSSARRKALANVIDVLFTKNRVSDAHYNEFLCDHGKAVFRLFADSLEKCRELSVRLTYKLFERSQDFTPILSYYIPALVQRLPPGLGYDDEMKIFVHDIEKHDEFKRGKAVDRQDKVDSVTPGVVKVMEPSEEIRFLLCQTLHLLLNRIKQIDAFSILQPYFNEIVFFSQSHLRDPYSEVKILSLENLHLLAKISDFELGMCMFSMALCRGIFPVLRHRHAKVRVAAVVALTSCMTVPFREKCKAAGSDCIPELIGFREDNVLSVASFYKAEVQVNYMAEIVCDNSVSVKEKVVAMLHELLTEIPDRFDHSQRLVPYLLDLLTDSADTVCHAALKVLQVCGKQYEEDHHDEIIDKRQYGVDGDNRINLDKKFPYPFLERPRIGLRLFSRGNSKRFIFALVNELTNWVSQTRIKSAKLLRLIIFLCEEHLTSEAHQLFPSYIKALVFAKDDGDKELHQILLEVFELVGRYMLPEIYLHFILPRLRGDKDIVQFGVDAKTRTSVLQLLTALIDGSKPSEVAPFFEEIVSCISNPLYIDPESVVIQSAAVECIVTLLKSLEGKGKIAIESVFLSTGRLKTLKVGMKSCFKFLLRGLANNSEEYSANAAEGLKLLSKLDESFINGVDDLFICYGKEVLLDVIKSDYGVILDSTWSASSVEHKLLTVLMECPYPLALSYVDGASGSAKIPLLGHCFNEISKWLSEMSGNAAFVTEFSRLLSSCLLPFHYSSFVSRSSAQYEHLLGSKVWRGEKWQAFMGSEAQQGLASFSTPLDGIFKFYLLDPSISRAITIGVALSSMDLSRLRMASICFGSSIDIEQKSADAYDKHDEVCPYMNNICKNITVRMVESPVFLTLMSNCTMPFANVSSRIQSVDIIATLFDLLSEAAGIDRVRNYSFNWDNLRANSNRVRIMGATKPYIDLLFSLLDDSSDTVVRAVVDIFSARGANFIAKTGSSDEGGVTSASYSRIVERLTRDLVSLSGISGANIESETDGGLSMLGGVEYALRTLAVLNPIPFETALRNVLSESSSQSSPLSPLALELISGLIDHASFLQQVAPK